MSSIAQRRWVACSQRVRGGVYFLQHLKEGPVRSLFTCASVPLLLVAFAATPTLAADPVFVPAHTTFPTANQGGADEGTCFINKTPGDARVRLDARVVVSDGRVQRLSGIQDPGVLGAGGADQRGVYFVPLARSYNPCSSLPHVCGYTLQDGCCVADPRFDCFDVCF
jgi:hypothetical protein